MSGIAALEEDKRQYVEQLGIVLASLSDDQGNAELLALKEELETAVQMLDESIAELKPKSAPPASAPPPQKAAQSPPPVQEKWSRENHPAFKKTGAAAAAAASPLPAAEEKDNKDQEAPVSYQVNDTVLAKWVSGDRGFYPARITSITGSAAAPMYTVKFKSYGNVETLRDRDIRPVPAQKRKADGNQAVGGSGGNATSSHANSPAPGTPTAIGASLGSSSNGVVASAAASLYPQAAQNAAETGEEPPVKKFKKIKAKKELEAGKNKWQDFNNKSKFAKSNKKDSMFRTPEGVRGRVGFTGSGQAMRKDPTRSRHIYQPNEELD